MLPDPHLPLAARCRALLRRGAGPARPARRRQAARRPRRHSARHVRRAAHRRRDGGRRGLRLRVRAGRGPRGRDGQALPRRARRGGQAPGRRRSSTPTWPTRRVDNIGAARRAMGSLDRTFREVLEGFAGGYNLYVQQHRDTLPPWVVEITAADALALTHTDVPTDAASACDRARAAAEVPRWRRRRRRLRACGLDRAGCRRRAPRDDRTARTPSPSPASRPTSGAPMLLGNPHLRWQQLYWEAHVKVPGRLDFYGSTLVGLSLAAGRLQRSPRLRADQQQLRQPRHLRAAPRPRAARSLPVRRQAAAASADRRGGRREERRRVDGDRAPHVLALAPRAHRLSQLDDRVRLPVDGGRRLAVVRGVLAAEPRAVAQGLHEGDVDAGSRPSRTTPMRTRTATSSTCGTRGSRSACRTARTTSSTCRAARRSTCGRTCTRRRDLPQMLNPPGGYIQNANNPPWYVTLRQPLDPARYPAYFERGELALRPQLALDMVEAREKFSVDDLKRLKYDTRLLLAERVKPALLAAIDGAGGAGAVRGARRGAQGARGVGRPGVGREPRRGAVPAVLGHLSRRGAAAVRRRLGREAAGRDAARHRRRRRRAEAPGRGREVDAGRRTARPTSRGATRTATGSATSTCPARARAAQLGAFRVQQFDAPAGQGQRVRVAGWADADRQLAGVRRRVGAARALHAPGAGLSRCWRTARPPTARRRTAATRSGSSRTATCGPSGSRTPRSPRTPSANTGRGRHRGQHRGQTRL